MKIRHRLLLNATISILLVAVLFSLIIISSRDVQQELYKSEIADKLAKETTSLIFLTHAFKENHNDRVKQQWDYEYKTILDLVKGDTAIPESGVILSGLNSLKEFFSSLEKEIVLLDKLIQGKVSEKEIEKINSRENILVVQIDLISQDILSRVFRISIDADKKIQEIQEQSNYLILSFTLGLLILIVINSVLTIKKINAPLLKLVDGAEMISKGNFDYSIEVSEKINEKNKTDEFDELITAFNTMSKRLGETIKGLKNEIEERKKTEDQVIQSLEEKNILLKEIHHRVKNNMQVISSLLSLQSEYIVNEQDRQMFIDSQNRVHSMALVHEMLYKSDSLAKIDFANLLNELVYNIKNSYGLDNKDIEVTINSDDFILEINNAIPCALVINELISNSFKHAFNGNIKGMIVIHTEVDNEKKHIITISDNGKGFPENVDFRNTKTLGMMLVNSLVNQLKGTIELNKKEGTEFLIIF